MKKHPISSKTAEIIATAGAFLLVAAVGVGAFLLNNRPAEPAETTPTQTDASTESTSRKPEFILDPLHVNHGAFHGDPAEFWEGGDWYRITVIQSLEELETLNGGSIPADEQQYDEAYFERKALIAYDYIVSQASTQVVYDSHITVNGVYVYVKYYHHPDAADTVYGSGSLVIETEQIDPQSINPRCVRDDVYPTLEEYEAMFGQLEFGTGETQEPDGNIGEDLAIQTALEQYGLRALDVENLSCVFNDSQEKPYYTVWFYYEGYNYEVTVGAYTPIVTDEQLTPAPDRYHNSPSDLSYFRFDGEQPLYGRELDLTGLEEGYLYCYDETTEEISLITGPIDDWIGYDQGYDITQEHIYYSPADEPTKVYRADFDGQNEVLICDIGEGEIIRVQYYGFNSSGRLYMLLDYNRVIVYNIAEGTTDVVMEQYYISGFLYDDVLQNDQTERIPILYWDGFLSKQEQDAAPHENFRNMYIYYIDTGENIEDNHL